MELFNGRPENMDGRLPREVRTYLEREFPCLPGIRMQRCSLGQKDSQKSAVPGILF